MDDEEEKTGCLGTLGLIFILAFFMPILWLAEKMQEITGRGAGSGFGSFITAIAMVAILALTAVVAAISGGVYMWRLM